MLQAAAAAEEARRLGRKPLAAQTSTLSSRLSALVNTTGCFGMHLFTGGHQAEQGGQSGGDLRRRRGMLQAGMFVSAAKSKQTAL